MLDHNGFEKKIYPSTKEARINQLKDVHMPSEWQETPRYSTRSQMRHTRAMAMRPDPSYDVDGDGFVGQQDYTIAKRHDLASSGRLTGGQRDSAIAETCRILGSRLHDDEIGGNQRARRVLTSLREQPELVDTVKREQRLRVAGSARRHPPPLPSRVRVDRAACARAPHACARGARGVCAQWRSLRCA